MIRQINIKVYPKGSLTEIENLALTLKSVIDKHMKLFDHKQNKPTKIKVRK